MQRSVSRKRIFRLKVRRLIPAERRALNPVSKPEILSHRQSYGVIEDGSKLELLVVIILQISTFGWLFRSATLWPAVFGILIAGLGIYCFIRPNRKLSLLVIFLSLVPALVGMPLVYSSAKEFTKLSSAETPPKPSEIVESVGSGLGTGVFSLFGTALPVYVASLALLRSWKRNPLLTSEQEGNSRAPMSSQARSARVTNGLNAYDPPDRTDEVFENLGDGFVPGSPLDAIDAARRGQNRQSADEDRDAIDADEV